MKTTAVLRNWTKDLMHLLYPDFCLVCRTEIPHAPSALCPVCEHDLHYTFFEDYTDPTALDQLFWGRVPVSATYALLYFEKDNDTQPVLHALKYRDRPDTARYFGERVGEKIARLNTFGNVQALVPVPLHHRKEFLRGYNQSKLLAEGIAAKTGIPVRDDLLRRAVFTESQTKKSKSSRWDNMQSRFTAAKGSSSLKHVAIVDDVVTTGSTLETCIRKLREEHPELQVSIISLALAR